MFEQRLRLVRKSLSEDKIDALLVSSAVNIAYLTGYSNFSTREREAYLFVTESSVSLFTDGRYIEGVRSILPKGLKVFLYTELFKKIRSSKAKRVGVEQNFTLSELKKFKRKTGLNFTLTEPLVEKLRAVKDDKEIKNIRLACKLTDKTYSDVLENIRMNITEKELAWRIERLIKENGGELAFEPIVAFGSSSAIPHHQTSNKKLINSDQFVLLDFGVKVNGYCSDMTRTLLTKNATNKARKIYETVRVAQQKAIEYISTSGVGPDSPEVDASKTAKVANDYLASKGFEKIPHGLGHGIGLEVHEELRLSPKSKNKLVKNNVFTIEPGIYIPGFGGVRIEDDFLLSDNLEQLTKSPK
ncbi:MAG: M24 family metallopeptidase [Candidatus Levybacteria bacterium]|nr:M24 family metallopeptidase [Candidatus Levybacteria bacterium]